MLKPSNPDGRTGFCLLLIQWGNEENVFAGSVVLNLVLENKNSWCN